MALRIDDVDLQRDRILVERFQEGDRTAFDTLYRRYFARLQRFCLKRVGDQHEAEEIAQEAFTRAFRALPALGGERRFYPWMTVIAGRLCVDHHRRRGRSEPKAVVDTGSVEGGQEAIVEQADVPLLTVALDRLAPRHREVLDLRETQGWTYHQIAEHYSVPVGTVEALLFRARKALKREFFAVAGADRWAAFGALPVLGAVARRWSWVKAKVTAWTSALPPAVAPALGVAVAVGSVAAVGVVSMPHHGSPGAQSPGAVRMVEAAAALPIATAAGGSSVQADDVAATGTEGTPSTPDAAAPPSIYVGLRNAEVKSGTRVMTADEAKEESEDYPVSVVVGDEDNPIYYLNADPLLIVEEIQETISGWW